MLITKFNRMIHNRLVWGVFAVLVSITFVATFGAGSGGAGQSKQDADSVGTLFKETVSAQQLNHALLFEMGMRDMPDMPDKTRAVYQRRAWQRLAALRTAARMGLTVSVNELLTAIQSESSFAYQGRFNAVVYTNVVRDQMRVSLDIFEQYIREELLIRKVKATMQTFVWTPPQEINDRIKTLTDTFVLDYALLTPSNTVGDIQATEADAKALFEQQRESFAIPPMVSVKYIEFPVSNYLSRVVLKDTDVKEYYDEHEKLFTTEDTNGLAKMIPIEDVRTNIEQIVTGKLAVDLARVEATDLIVAAQPRNRGEKAKPIEEVAAAAKLNVLSTPWFANGPNIEGLSVGRPFIAAAFELDPSDPIRSFSDPVFDQDKVYVLAFNSNVSERIPDFGEVRERAIVFASARAKRAAFLEKATQIREVVQKDVAAGKPFAEAITNQNLTAITSRPFSIYTGDESNAFEYAEQVSTRLSLLSRGDVSELIAVEGGALLAYVAERKQGDLAMAETIRPQLAAALERYRSDLIYGDWSESLLEKAGFEDRTSDKNTSTDASEPAAK